MGAHVMEQALLAFLTRGDEGETLTGQATQQDEMHAMLRDLQAMFLQFLTALGTLPTPQEAPSAVTPPVPIATYEQLYGPIDIAPPVVVEPPASQEMLARSGRLRRWLLREEQA